MWQKKRGKLWKINKIRKGSRTNANNLAHMYVPLYLCVWICKKKWHCNSIIVITTPVAKYGDWQKKVLKGKKKSEKLCDKKETTVYDEYSHTSCSKLTTAVRCESPACVACFRHALVTGHLFVCCCCCLLLCFYWIFSVIFLQYFFNACPIWVAPSQLDRKGIEKKNNKGFFKIFCCSANWWHILHNAALQVVRCHIYSPQGYSIKSKTGWKGLSSSPRYNARCQGYAIIILQSYWVSIFVHDLQNHM